MVVRGKNTFGMHARPSTKALLARRELSRLLCADCGRAFGKRECPGERPRCPACGGAMVAQREPGGVKP